MTKVRAAMFTSKKDLTEEDIKLQYITPAIISKVKGRSFQGVNVSEL